MTLRCIPQHQLLEHSCQGRWYFWFLKKTAAYSDFFHHFCTLWLYGCVTTYFIPKNTVSTRSVKTFVANWFFRLSKSTGFLSHLNNFLFPNANERDAIRSNICCLRGIFSPAISQNPGTKISLEIISWSLRSLKLTQNQTVLFILSSTTWLILLQSAKGIWSCWRRTATSGPRLFYLALFTAVSREEENKICRKILLKKLDQFLPTF